MRDQEIWGYLLSQENAEIIKDPMGFNEEIMIIEGDKHTAVICDDLSTVVYSGLNLDRNDFWGYKVSEVDFNDSQIISSMDEVDRLMEVVDGNY
jgi:hypothetical protein